MSTVMDGPFGNHLFFVHYFPALTDLAESLQCYSCVSSAPGCGKELNIRLEKTIQCPPSPTGRENFCVKLMETKGSKYILYDTFPN